MERPSPLQCSVKVKLPGSEPTLLNTLDCQIFPLGHHYRMIGWDLKEYRTTGYRGVAFLPLNKEIGGGGEFIVLLNYTKYLLVLRSAEMRWIQVKKFPISACQNLVAFRGKFYGTLPNRNLLVIDPYSLDLTTMMPLQPLHSVNYLVPSGDDDELFLVETIFRPTELIIRRFTCIVSRLDEKGGKWVEVSDLGGRVLFVGHSGHVSCCARELPHGCGVSGNSLLFSGPGNETDSYKYGVNTGREEDDLNIWRFSRENRVTIINISPVLWLSRLRYN